MSSNLAFGLFNHLSIIISDTCATYISDISGIFGSVLNFFIVKIVLIGCFDFISFQVLCLWLSH